MSVLVNRVVQFKITGKPFVPTLSMLKHTLTAVRRMLHWSYLMMHLFTWRKQFN